MPTPGELVIRRYEDRDEDEVVRLLGRSLGKEADERYRAFFRWKHLANPAGPSLAWVAEVDGRLAGYRAFLRWRFRGPDGPMDAVRAVDTATAPEHRGAGVFRRLTEHGLARLAPEGVSFIFNTPNDQSRPGYLKMGWEVVGRAPVRARPRSVRTVPRILTARAPAILWSVPTDVGVSAAEALASPDVNQLVAAVTAGSPLGAAATDRTGAFLRWRYAGFDPVASRALLDGDAASDGMVLFRLRQRGGALECTVGDVLVADPARGAALVRRALQETKADYALVGAAPGGRLPGFLASERLGPVLTWRAVGSGEVRPALALTLGDLELF
jgi:GNAT superfamily N-acetyltransferase